MKLTIENIDTITLSHGKHMGPDEGMCLLEATALFSGEPFNDHPACVDSVLASFGMAWNDGMRSDAERAQLRQYIARLVGTNKGPELSQKRGWMAMDWLIRVHTAAWLCLTPALAPHGEALKVLEPITCEADLSRAMPALDKARTCAREAWAAARAAARDAAGAAAGDAARDAAWDAAGAAAGDAARAAARAAAWDAARAAARAAARDAAWDAAGAAARDAAWDAAGAAAGDAARAAAGAKLEPTVLALQTSAHELFSRMIDAE
ncbi:hypothetical protein PQQ63_15150 [Paraburkholderia metrosideri]|uniref:Uncharacterized protein n=1 Tax=Paraburkholderia metrosideri TaxID=580937 RepID=A0ABW9DSP9_9BURK